MSAPEEPCRHNVGPQAAGSACDVCGHTGYAHPPMGVGPCSICVALVSVRAEVVELRAVVAALRRRVGAALQEVPPHYYGGPRA